MNKPAAIGVDVGSTTWKAVIVDGTGKILSSRVEPGEPLIEVQTLRSLVQLRQEAGVKDEDLPVGATGYGRKKVKATKALTEITCHAKGAWFLTGKPGILIDIGGQDSKVIHVGDGGEVVDFAMNDKCAAGTGRFLEVILDRLNVPMNDISDYVAKADKAISISSTCTVFAESEVVSLVARGEKLEEIIKGLHVSLSSRIAALAGRVDQSSAIFMSGGVALNGAMHHGLQDTMGLPISVLPKPQLVGALGAALSVL